MPPIVEVQGLSKAFGRGNRTVQALCGVNVFIEPGTVVGLIGPNGAGKSTLISCILGLIKPDGGKAFVFGEDPIAGRSRILGKVGVILDGSRLLFPPMTVWQNLYYVGLLHNVPFRCIRERIRAVAERTQIESLLGSRSFRLSLGQKQRVLIACALLTEPDLLVLDEPTTGLDDTGIQMMADYVRTEVQRGTTILIASHQLEWLESVADEFLLLSEGRVVWQGNLTQYNQLAGTKPEWIVEGSIPSWTCEALSALSAVIHRLSPEQTEISLPGQTEHYLEVFRLLSAGGCRIMRFTNDGLSLREVYRELMAAEVQRTIDRVSRASRGGR